MMKYSILVAILLAFCFSMMALSFQYSHLLMSLFCLEAMLLSMVLLICLVSCDSQMLVPHSMMILLSMGACEASLALSLMVKMSRMYGSDMFNLLSTSKC